MTMILIFEGGDDELDRFEEEEHNQRWEEKEDFWQTIQLWEGARAILKTEKNVLICIFIL